MSVSEVRIERLGRQQKEVLRYLYDHRGSRHQQADIIRELYGEVTTPRRVSMSRSVRRLRRHGIVDSQRKAQSGVSHPVDFNITEDGERFVEKDSRFPDISGSGVLITNEASTDKPETKTDEQEHVEQRGNGAGNEWYTPWDKLPDEIPHVKALGDWRREWTIKNADHYVVCDWVENNGNPSDVTKVAEEIGWSAKKLRSLNEDVAKVYNIAEEHAGKPFYRLRCLSKE